MNILDVGLRGVQRGFAGFNLAAERVATGAAEAPDELASAVVDMHRFAHQIEASARVISRADEVLASLLDIGRERG